MIINIICQLRNTFKPMNSKFRGALFNVSSMIPRGGSESNRSIFRDCLINFYQAALYHFPQNFACILLILLFFFILKLEIYQPALPMLRLLRQVGHYFTSCSSLALENIFEIQFFKLKVQSIFDYNFFFFQQIATLYLCIYYTL